MAFDRSFLAKTGGTGKAGHSWKYKTEDALTDVDTDAYFPTSVGFQLGDKIDVAVVTNIGTDTEALTDMGAVIVNQISPTVDTTNETSFVTTDTD